METKKQEAVEQVVPGSQAGPEADPFAAATGDPEAKKRGASPSGGIWYKNYRTGMIYRVDNVGGRPMVVESMNVFTSPPLDKKQAKKAPKAARGDSRATLLKQAQERGFKYIAIMSKSELTEILATHEQEKINSIIKKAKERWQAGTYFQQKAKKEQDQQGQPAIDIPSEPAG